MRKVESFARRTASSRAHQYFINHAPYHTLVSTNVQNIRLGELRGKWISLLDFMPSIPRQDLQCSVHGRDADENLKIIVISSSSSQSHNSTLRIRKQKCIFQMVNDNHRNRTVYSWQPGTELAECLCFINFQNFEKPSHEARFAAILTVQISQLYNLVEQGLCNHAGPHITRAEGRFLSKTLEIC